MVGNAGATIQWKQKNILKLLITLLPAGKTQLMEHDTPLGQGSFRSSRNPVG